MAGTSTLTFAKILKDSPTVVRRKAVAHCYSEKCNQGKYAHNMKSREITDAEPTAIDCHYCGYALCWVMEIKRRKPKE